MLVVVHMRAAEALVRFVRPTKTRDRVIWLRSRAAPRSGPQRCQVAEFRGKQPVC